MRDLQQQVIEAHGGLERFRRFSFLTARLHQFGILWDLKGRPDTLTHAEVRVNLRKEEVSHWPFHPTHNRSRFTPDEVTIETPEGDVIERLTQPRASFAGFAMETHWSDPQLAYFSGYAMWTYLTSPFILAQPGVVAEEIAPWLEQGETWRRLRVTFPATIATHSSEQTLYIGPDGLVRRHDYEVEIQGDNAAARYLLEPVVVEGIVLPSKFRVYPRNPDNTPAAKPLIVGVDLSDYRFE
ncbi:hypothetical protein [Novosphingobium sp. ST904]|uniref:hypothetical protein n=1 Tax=Novosphingobium sp. ST904 TaxID=1684385 RepID=UPI0006C8992C|nr:hypothetical protein [Novosphingobium sp. ST904]KPH66132.1 hypothetical protein ADT71_07695 [Novosphingobium sp. ST904]TCM27207.1 hypothetical protein EDF59_13264 [Novosphingobium sp. ST904]